MMMRGFDTGHRCVCVCVFVCH